jgi:hypothetical protein
MWKLFGLIFGGAGVLLIGVAVWSANHQYNIVKQWPSVDAEVTSSQVTQDESRSSSRGTSTSMYRARIEFRYSVDGREYLTPGTTGYASSSYPEMKRKADAFPPGSRRAIRYNPSDPNDIRFDADFSFGFFFFPILFGGMGLLFAGMGTLFIRLGHSEKPMVCPACRQTVGKGQRFCANCGMPLGAG